jgi:hypothetical protein
MSGDWLHNRFYRNKQPPAPRHPSIQKFSFLLQQFGSTGPTGLSAALASISHKACRDSLLGTQVHEKCRLTLSRGKYCGRWANCLRSVARQRLFPRMSEREETVHSWVVRAKSDIWLHCDCQPRCNFGQYWCSRPQLTNVSSGC